MSDGEKLVPLHIDDESMAAALALMQDWQWLRYNPDHELISASHSLGHIINRLAMEGQANPRDDVLRLLGCGDLFARGDYRWKKFAAGEYYEMEGNNHEIPAIRWRDLHDLLTDEKTRLEGFEGPLEPVRLEKLADGQWPPYIWNHVNSEFSIALCPPETLSHEKGYFEETFSATNIEVYLPDIEGDPDEFVPTDRVTNTDKGGRPPAARWEAAVLELSGRYYLGDFKPNTLADVKRELREFLAKDGVDPADSTIGNHAKPIFDAFLAWEKDAQKPG